MWPGRQQSAGRRAKPVEPCWMARSSFCCPRLPAMQLVAIFALVGQSLGYPAACAGCAVLLLTMPVQAALARRISRVRAATAAATDARVRLASEAIGGVLAAKMLGWEGPLLQRLAALRAAEARQLRRMASIRAANMALSWAVAPLSALGAFGVARALGRQLSMPDVYYVVALLSIPKLCERAAVQCTRARGCAPDGPVPGCCRALAGARAPLPCGAAPRPHAHTPARLLALRLRPASPADLTDFFVVAVQAAAELRVSVRRLAAFLALPEPPAPWLPPSSGGRGEAAPAPPATAAPAAAARQEDEPPAIEVAGADFDWADRSWAGGEAGGSAAQQQQPAAAGAPTVPDCTLPGLRLAVRRGELLAVVGAVGSGKSSLLAALLGELQPVAGSWASGDGAPAVAVRGAVAYCAQAPWIEAGTVKVGEARRCRSRACGGHLLSCCCRCCSCCVVLCWRPEPSLAPTDPSSCCPNLNGPGRITSFLVGSTLRSATPLWSKRARWKVRPGRGGGGGGRGRAGDCRAEL